MRRSGLLLVLATACITRVPYVPPTAVAPAQRIGVARLDDSTRNFFDSLGTARRRDSVRLIGLPASRQIVSNDSLTSVAWLDIVRDTTLSHLIEIALRQSPTLRLAAARVDEYRANVGIARAPLRPSITLNGSESGGHTVLGGPFPSTAFQATRATGDLAWELDFWGRIQHGIDAANADLGGQVAAERAAVLSLVGDVSTGYFCNSWSSIRSCTIAERTLSSRQSTLDLARARYAQGLTSELDVRQFEAQVAAPAVTLAQLEQASAETEHNLNVLLGQGPTGIPRGPSLSDAVRTLVIPDSIPAALLSRRPDLEEAERNYAAATARAGLADAAHYPTVTIGATVGGQTPTPYKIFGSDARIYQGVIAISFPLFDNGKIANASLAARARVDQARVSYEGVMLNALREAGDALTVVRASAEQTVAQATQATALRQALDLAQLRYQAGLATYLDVLDAQRSLFTAELSLSQAQLSELTAAVRLYKALGGSWAGR